jgi:hypothetical protein
MLTTGGVAQIYYKTTSNPNWTLIYGSIDINSNEYVQFKNKNTGLGPIPGDSRKI